MGVSIAKWFSLLTANDTMSDLDICDEPICVLKICGVAHVQVKSQ